MKKSELRQIIKEEIKNILSESNLKVGDKAKLNLKKAFKAAWAMKPWERLVRDEYKDGKGTVIVSKIDGDRVEIYGGLRGKFLGGVQVPLNSLTKESISINESIVSQVSRDIKKYKKQLENRWKTKGAYENFGQKEVRKLEDKYIGSSSYSYTPEMNQVRDLIQGFDDWAMNYTGE